MVGTEIRYPAGRSWYVLRAKPRRETAAAALLKQAGIEVYLPQVNVPKPARKTAALEPLFPGYLFSRLDPGQGEIRLAKFTSGILYVVGTGEEAWPLPDELIESIRERIARNGGAALGPSYRAGDRVVITGGPLRDLEAIFDQKLSADGRVRVLIRILRRLCRAEVHIAQIRPLSKAASAA